MQRHYDVIIVGAGAMGMAAGYYLAKEDVSTLMIDAHDPPHTHGSHGGDTRLIRHAVGEGRQYIPLALRSQKLWDELHTHADTEIFRRTGILNFGHPESEFLEQTIEGARAYDLNIEMLSRDEMMERWPGLEPGEGDIGYYEADGGVIFGENAIRTFRRLALEYGAELHTDAPVRNIHLKDDAVKVETEDGSFTADKLIMAAGAWNGRLLSDLGVDVPIQPSRRTIAWFEADEAQYASERFPGFIARSDEGQYYGFPSIDGTGLKIGRYDGGDDSEPEKMDRLFGAYGKDEGDLRHFLGTHMKGANGSLNEGVTCIFCNTPDEDFIIDHHPDHSNVIIAGGFSGHGFKYATGVGEILTELVTEGKTRHDISSFSIHRHELQKKT